MVARIRNRLKAAVADRPYWLPHPMLLNLIAALWIGAFALQLLARH